MIYFAFGVATGVAVVFGVMLIGDSVARSRRAKLIKPLKDARKKRK